MKSSFLTLVAVELRRGMTPVTMALPFLLMGLTGAFLLATMRHQSVVDVPLFLMNFLAGFVVPIGVPMFALGLVAADVKDHWLRTLLMRPITRTDYLLSRLTAVYLLVLATMILSGIVPILVLSNALDKPVVWAVSRSLPAFGFMCAHALTLLLLLTFLSCWLSGMGNVIMLALWFIGSSVISTYVQWRWWDSGVAIVTAEFLFPSGFYEAAEMSARNSGFPLGPALWGIAAAILTLALSIWSVNRMTLDGGSE